MRLLKLWRQRAGAADIAVHVCDPVCRREAPRTFRAWLALRSGLHRPLARVRHAVLLQLHRTADDWVVTRDHANLRNQGRALDARALPTTSPEKWQFPRWQMST